MPNYACKLCIWNKKLYGERFRDPESWFHTPKDLLAHWNSEHDMQWGADHTEYAAWPGALQDAQANAEGYLVCCRTAEPADGYQFTCYRCEATTFNLEDLKNLYCLSCGHRFPNFYEDLDEVIGASRNG